MPNGEESELYERQGVITYYDPVRSSGIIDADDGRTFLFSSYDLTEEIYELHSFPAVLFKAKNERAIQIRNDSERQSNEKIYSGSVFLGAAKCPNCSWRLPMFPDPKQAAIRRGDSIYCPSCKTYLRLSSLFKRFHTSMTWGIVVAALMATRSMLQWWGRSDVDQRPLIVILILIVLAIFTLAFFFVYLQEELVEDDD